MKLNKLMPWRWNDKKTGDGGRQAEELPILALQRNMNRMFEDFFSGFELEPFTAAFTGGFNPAINVSETDKSVQISAELPGLEEKDIQLSVEEDVLVLSGEKKAEQETKDEKGVYRMERSYGSFKRVIPLPAEVVVDKAEAVFKQGVLHVTLPKKPEAQTKAKKIVVKHEE